MNDHCLSSGKCAKDEENITSNITFFANTGGKDIGYTGQIKVLKY